jgi:Ricin-type beta-trefoil lectin domain/Pectate lyase superfamily protein
MRQKPGFTSYCPMSEPARQPLAVPRGRDRAKRIVGALNVLLMIVVLGASEIACSAAAKQGNHGHGGSTSSSSGTIVTPPLGSIVALKNLNSGLCVDTGGSSGFTVLTQTNCNNAASQNFYFQSSPASGYYYLTSNASGMCWDVSGGSTSAGALIQQYTCTAVSPEYYQLREASNGVYNVLSGNLSNGCIDTAGGSTAPGAQIEQNTCNGSANQTYALVTPASQTPVSISISPTSASIISGGTQQFADTVSGSANTAVTWSASAGSVSSTGLFTAPTVSTNTSATVTVVSQADTTKYASAMVTVSPNSGTTNAVNVTSYGATGNGSKDDTNAIKQAIGALTSGSTLLFPCGTYVTSSQLFINVSNVTVDGSGCAVIHDTGSGTVMVIGGSGNGNPNYGSAVALSSTANELATSFTTVSSLGVSPGDYVLLQQGGEDSSNGSGNTGCDPSGCRGEVVKVAAVSGNTVTVTTALHDAYSPSINAATAQKITGPLTGITVKNITLDGNGSNVYGLAIAGVGDSTVSGVTVKNVEGSALLNRGDFNVAWSSITVIGAGSAQCGSAVWFQAQGNLSVDGMNVSNENPGTGSGCLSNGAFGFELIQSANSTITNLTVDASGAYGRPFKTTAARYNIFNSPTVKNGVQAYNGISLEYYSSHNTYNSCVVTNNGAATGTATGNAGINTFGNFNQYNTFNNCTVSGNGNVQVLINNYDALRLGQDTHNEIKGGTYTGSNTAEPVLYLADPDVYVTSTYVNGPGSVGIYLGSTNACVNNVVFGVGTNLGGGISSSSSTNLGLGNILNGLSSNLTLGTCTGP